MGAAAVVAALSLTGPSSLLGQTVVRMDVGASSLYGAYGTRAQWYAAQSQGWMAVASGPDASMGGWIQTRLGGLHVGAGDAAVDLALPTDRLGGSPRLLGRGLVVADSGGSFRWTGFAGWGARARSPVPGLVTAESGGRVARIAADASLGADLRWHMLQTWAPGGAAHVQSLTWEPAARLRLDASAGRMAGAPYASLAGSVVTRRLELVALGTHAPRMLRRMALPGVLFAEDAGFNGRIAWRPREGWYVEASRTRRSPTSPVLDPTPPRTIHQIAGGLSVGRSVSLRGGVHHSPDPAGGEASQGARLGLSTRISSTVRGDVAYYVSHAGENGTSEMAVLTLRERVRPSLELLQRLSFQGWELPSVSLGGRLERGGTSFGVDYRTDFVPAAAGPQFRTALVLDVRLQLSPTRDVTASTYLDAGGDAHYQVRAGQWLYPGAPSTSGAAGPGPGPAEASYRFPDHLVRGRVMLEDGTPVEGAALALGERVVHTDAAGRFLLRTEDSEALRLEVRLEDFLVPGRFRVVEAPDQVRTRREGDADEVVVVLQRIVRRRTVAEVGGAGE